MFEKLKTLVGLDQESRRSWTDQVADYDLSACPLTKAMLQRTAAETDDAVKSLRKMSVNINASKGPHNLMDFIESAVSQAASGITDMAMANVGRPYPFQPLEPLPRDIGIIVAFGFVAIAGMINPLRDEGHNIDLQRTCERLVGSMFLYRPIKEQEQMYRLGSDIFRQLMRGATEKNNVHQWLDSYTLLVCLYIEQWKTNAQQQPETDFPMLFGSALKTVLATAD
jgi:hypothetical protein